MTKAEEQKLLKRVDELTKQVAILYEIIESNKLTKHTYTVTETAKILNVTPKTVYNMIDKGQLETIMLGHIKVLGSSLREKLGAS